MNEYNFSIASVPFEIKTDLPINFSRSSLSQPIKGFKQMIITVKPIFEVLAKGDFFSEIADKSF